MKKIIRLENKYITRNILRLPKELSKFRGKLVIDTEIRDALGKFKGKNVDIIIMEN